jgi:hypothetical protein
MYAIHSGALEETGEFENGKPVYTYSQQWKEMMYSFFDIMATKPFHEWGPVICAEMTRILGKPIQWLPDEF